MRNPLIKYLIGCLLLLAMQGYAQEKRNLKAEDNPSYFSQKPLRWGLAWHNSWSTILGKNAPYDYFAKPSVGICPQVEYFFKPNLGLRLGLAFQQRGAGILTPDYVKEVGNADSTYRYRLRFNSFELPVSLAWRQQQPTLGGMRFSAGLGIAPAFIVRTGTIFHSVEDGFHINENRTQDFKRFDLLGQLHAGVDLNAADACMLQLHLFYQYGFINPYQSSFSNAKGNNSNLGLKISFMF